MADRVALDTLELAFGPNSLGILLVRDLPATYAEQRVRVMSSGSDLAHLAPESLGLPTVKESEAET